MTNLDKVIEYLHYHSGASRRELMEALVLGIKDTQMKALLGDGIASGSVIIRDIKISLFRHRFDLPLYGPLGGVRKCFARTFTNALQDIKRVSWRYCK